MNDSYALADQFAPVGSGSVTDIGNTGSYWIGEDGNIWYASASGTKNMGKPISTSQDGFAAEFGSAQATWDNSQVKLPTGTTTDNNKVSGGGGGGGGYTEPAKVLDTAQLASLDALLARLDANRANALSKAKTTRDTAKKDKDAEKEREKGKYEGSKLSTLQDFGGALNDTTLNTRNTLENLMSSLSTLGLGGSRALTRQLLDAANKSKREANATQATDTKNLDNAFNEYTAGYSDDVQKIEDQYGYDTGTTNENYYTERQNTLYKKGDVYGDYGDTATRGQIMGEADGLNSLITGSTFLNPGYKGASRAMATPELGDYTQKIAKFDTTGVQGANAPTLTPVASDGMNAPGNLAVRAIAVNDKDLGIKKKSENDLGYGV